MTWVQALQVSVTIAVGVEDRFNSNAQYQPRLMLPWTAADKSFQYLNVKKFKNVCRPTRVLVMQAAL